jgi:hypothetical protein
MGRCRSSSPCATWMPHAELRDQFAVVVGTVLAATIRVQNQPWRGPFAAHRPPQCLRRQSCVIRAPIS